MIPPHLYLEIPGETDGGGPLAQLGFEGDGVKSRRFFNGLFRGVHQG